MNLRRLSQKVSHDISKSWIKSHHLIEKTQVIKVLRAGQQQ